jgi:hypothetical protein
MHRSIMLPPLSSSVRDRFSMVYGGDSNAICKRVSSQRTVTMSTLLRRDVANCAMSMRAAA